MLQDYGNKCNRASLKYFIFSQMYFKKKNDWFMFSIESIQIY